MLSAAVLGLVIAPAWGVAEPRRPTSISMGVSGAVEGAPFAREAVALPVTIDVGTVVDGDFWWHGSASFGATSTPDGIDGHDFDLRTGPRWVRCWTRYCAGAGVELGWGHSRWALGGGSVTYDDFQIEGRVRASVALSPSGLVQLEASAGPRVRYYLRGESTGDTLATDPIDHALNRGVAAGVALVVRN